MGFANDIAVRIAERFPSDTFLQSLAVLNPAEWKKQHDTRYISRMSTISLETDERSETIAGLAIGRVNPISQPDPD